MPDELPNRKRSDLSNFEELINNFQEVGTHVSWFIRCLHRTREDMVCRAKAYWGGVCVLGSVSCLLIAVVLLEMKRPHHLIIIFAALWASGYWMGRR